MALYSVQSIETMSSSHSVIVKPRRILVLHKHYKQQGSMHVDEEPAMLLQISSKSDTIRVHIEFWEPTLVTDILVQNKPGASYFQRITDSNDVSNIVMKSSLILGGSHNVDQVYSISGSIIYSTGIFTKVDAVFQTNWTLSVLNLGDGGWLQTPSHTFTYKFVVAAYSTVTLTFQHFTVKTQDGVTHEPVSNIVTFEFEGAGTFEGVLTCLAGPVGFRFVRIRVDKSYSASFSAEWEFAPLQDIDFSVADSGSTVQKFPLPTQKRIRSLDLLLRNPSTSSGDDHCCRLGFLASNLGSGMMCVNHGQRARFNRSNTSFILGSVTKHLILQFVSRSLSNRTNAQVKVKKLTNLT